MTSTLPLARRAAVLLLATAAACAPAAPAAGPAPAPLAPPSGRAAIGAALDSVFADSLFARATWGVAVRSLDTGEWLYRRNADRMFVPASNLKLVTGAAALAVLGADFRFETAVAATGPIEGGVLRGDLVVVGGGDPSVAERFGGDATAVLRAWADSLRARGVARIAGDVVGDDDALDDVPFGAGWAWDDVDASYSAEVGALPFNDGFVTVIVSPGARAGEPARVALRPATAYVPVRVEAVTGAPGTEPRIVVTRDAAGPGMRVSGTIAAGAPAVARELSVRDNTRYFVTVLRETLLAAGIAVDGAAVDADDRPGAATARRDTLFLHRSPPFPAVLAAFLQPSQNQYGELLLKTMGRVERGMGTAGAGIAVVDSLSRAWGMPADALRQADGSGLSRYNLVAPEYLVALLAHRAASPDSARFAAALPTAGVDGTLAARMRGTPLAGNVRAKTGTLSGIRSLAGYLTTAAGERIVFSIVVNHHTRTARDADRVTEAALLRLHALPR